MGWVSLRYEINNCQKEMKLKCLCITPLWNKNWSHKILLVCFSCILLHFTFKLSTLRYFSFSLSSNHFWNQNWMETCLDLVLSSWWIVQRIPLDHISEIPLNLSCSWRPIIQHNCQINQQIVTISSYQLKFIICIFPTFRVQTKL